MSDEKFTLKITNKSKDHADLLLTGDLSINTIEEVTMEFQTLTQVYTSLDIKAKQIDKIDLPFLQLLYAVKKTCKKMTLDLTLENDQRELIENAGIIKLLI